MILVGATKLLAVIKTPQGKEEATRLVQSISQQLCDFFGKKVCLWHLPSIAPNNCPWIDHWHGHGRPDS